MHKMLCSYVIFGVCFNINASIVTIDAKSIHVPLGFDSNDDAEVGVVVDLPDTCHRRPFGEVKYDGENITINVKAEKITPTNGNFCIQALIPTLVSVSIGKLFEGNYKVIVNENQGNQKWSSLKVASPGMGSIDDYTYANVTNIKKSADGSMVYLEGYHPSPCMEIERIELIVNEAKDTISVMPIVTQTQDVCEQVIKPFTHAINLKNLAANEIVLHVRKIDGRAINYKI